MHTATLLTIADEAVLVLVVVLMILTHPDQTGVGTFQRDYSTVWLMALAIVAIVVLTVTLLLVSVAPHP